MSPHFGEGAKPVIVAVATAVGGGAAVKFGAAGAVATAVAGAPVIIPVALGAAAVAGAIAIVHGLTKK